MDFAILSESSRMKLCKSCRMFVKKFKKWDERKVPKVYIGDFAVCRMCRMSYDIYKGMIWPIPFMTKKEEKMIDKEVDRKSTRKKF